MALLEVKPSLSDICTAVLGHYNTGDNFLSCLSSAHSYNFDSVYAGSKDRFSNFGLYGDPTETVTPMSLSWVWNSTSVKTFTVTNVNHSTWKFWSGIDITGWTVSVYDLSNTTKLGDFSTSTLWPTDCTIRVKPNSNNTGGDNKYLFLYATTYNDHLITDGYCECEQDCQIIQPTVGFEGDGVTLTNTSYSITIGSPYVYIWYTPNDMATSPHKNWYTMTKPGPVTLYTGVRNNCYNGVYVNSWLVTMSEPAVNGGTYLFYIMYDNV